MFATIGNATKQEQASRSAKMNVNYSRRPSIAKNRRNSYENIRRNQINRNHS